MRRDVVKAIFNKRKNSTKSGIYRFFHRSTNADINDVGKTSITTTMAMTMAMTMKHETTRR